MSLMFGAAHDSLYRPSKFSIVLVHVAVWYLVANHEGTNSWTLGRETGSY